MDGDRAHEAMNNDDKASSWLVLLNGRHLYRPMCNATKLIKQAYDWLWAVFIRAMCTVTQLSIDCKLVLLPPLKSMCTQSSLNSMKLMNDMWDSFCWQFIVKFLGPFAPRRSSWTTMRQAHQWLWIHYTHLVQRLMPAKFMNNYEAISWLIENSIHSSCTEPHAREAHKPLWSELMFDWELILLQPCARRQSSC
jgi:hypothetical protein